MSAINHRYFILHKPTNMVSQFTGNDKVRQLSALSYEFPEGTHAIGRLDSDSEGLLLLSNNKKVTRLLFKSKVPHKRTYLVKVRYQVSEETLQQLRTGVRIRIRGGADWVTSPCEVQLADDLSKYHVTDEKHEYSPYCWLLMSLTEGKYHQVRKMVFALGHRCKRLIRVAIEDLTLDDLPPGHIKEIAEDDFFRRLKIKEYT
ncbi:MAG: rRNA pseudouridine synthase [Chitinophagales bacterium]|nr:rRNA pseudouridine synthase [Chitinophagales bacterium]